MKKQLLCVLISFILVMVLTPPGTLLGAPYYQGKMITIISGHAPGGGYDRMARLLAKHLSKYIPGNPSVTVQNMPGAGSLISGNYIFNQAKPDGLTLGSVDRGLVFSQLVKEEGVMFDLKKYAWIGSTGSEPSVFMVRSDLPYHSFSDLLKSKDPIYVGDIGIGGSPRIVPLILKDSLGVKFNLVSYTGGSADVMLAIEKKEIDATYFTYSSHKPQIIRGLVRPLLRSRVSLPEIEKLPVNEDVVRDKKSKALLSIFSDVDRIARPYFAPPGTPDQAMAVLREAFKKVAEDPELQADAQKVMLFINYLSAQECLRIIDSVFNQPEEIVKEFIRYSKL